MKNTIFLICIMLFAKFSFGQINYSWATTGPYNTLSAVADNSNNNLYSLGQSMQQNKLHTVISKLEPSTGVNIWSYTLFSIFGANIPKKMIIDREGNIIICGIYTGVVDFDPSINTHELNSPSTSYSIFLAKYDSDGNYLWAISLDGEGPFNTPASICVDSENNIYMLGSITGSVDFDPSTNTQELVTNGASDVFLCKYSDNGNHIWSYSFGADQQDSARDLLFYNDNLYISGLYSKTIDVDFGNGVLNLPEHIYNDGFLIKYDLNGNLIFANSMGSNGGDNFNQMAVFDNNLYITGGFEDTVDFDNGSNEYNLISDSISSDFIAKYNAGDGQIIWAKKTLSKIIAIDANENGIFISGTNNDTISINTEAGTEYLMPDGYDIFIGGYNFDGNCKWIKLINAPNYQSADEIGVYNNIIYMSGQITDSLDFDLSPNINYLVGKSFITKYSLTTTEVINVPIEKSINVFPNPSTGEYVIIDKTKETLGPVYIQITNTLGQVVYNTKTTPSKTGIYNINVFDLPAGIYILDLNTNKNHYYHHLIKNN